jgi:hypothetical protein
MKMIFKLSGIAIGLVSIFTAKLMFIETKDRILELNRLEPVQFKIDKDSPQRSREFSPRFDANYDLNFIPSSIEIGGNAPAIAPPSISVKILENGRELDIRKYTPSLCENRTRYPCKIASFAGVTDRKYTISIDTKNIDSRWYAFKPIVETDISTSYYAEYRAASEVNIGYVFISGISILLVSIMMLTIDLILQAIGRRKRSS